MDRLEIGTVKEKTAVVSIIFYSGLYMREIKRRFAANMIADSCSPAVFYAREVSCFAFAFSSHFTPYVVASVLPIRFSREPASANPRFREYFECPSATESAASSNEVVKMENLLREIGLS